MKRRDFLKTAVTTAAGLAGTAAMTSSTQAAPATGPGGREYYELRTYTVTAAQWTRLEEYFGTAFIPALNRFGITPVGVFTEKTTTPEFPVFVVIPFKSVEEITTLSEKLAADAKHQQDGAA
ncbi:MAG TPA: NIPSNAP family protein, partial [Roseimicrobium sp.]|nr:NIPSNAP family protein [Roseimicrobium sp.]